MGKRSNCVLISFDKDRAGVVVAVCQSTDQAASPIEVITGDSQSRIAVVGRNLSCSWEEWNKRIEGVACKAEPFDGSQLLFSIRTDLNDGKEGSAADADRAIGAFVLLVSESLVGIIGGSLIMRGKDVFGIFNRDLSLRFSAPGDIIAFRCVVGIDSIPLVASGVEVSFHHGFRKQGAG